MGSSRNATMGFGSNTYVKAAYGQVVNLDMSVFKFVCFIALGKKRYYKLNPSYHSIFGLEIFEYR